jgi:CBS domain containing-hemolysin-like protein
MRAFLLGLAVTAVPVLGLLLAALLKINIFSWNTLAEARGPLRMKLSAFRFWALVVFLVAWTVLVFLFPAPAFPQPWLPPLIHCAAAALNFTLLLLALTPEAAEGLIAAARPLLGLADALLAWMGSGPAEETDESEGDDEPTEAEVQTYLDMGKEHGILEEGESAMLESVIDFAETLVREVMTPRTDMITVAADDPFAKVLKIFGQSGFSRLPVTGRSLDDVAGMVHFKDFMRALADAAPEGIGTLIRPVPLVPETKKVNELLKELREARQKMAIVVDEYGGTAGLITLEDLVEELVGEIEDEQAIPQVLAAGKGAWSVAGKVHIEELNEAAGLALESAESDTVAGFVSSALGRIPRTGDTLTAAGADFTVESADERRVYRILVKRRDDVPKENS